MKWESWRRSKTRTLSPTKRLSMTSRRLVCALWWSTPVGATSFRKSNATVKSSPLYQKVLFDGTSCISFGGSGPFMIWRSCTGILSVPMCSSRRMGRRPNLRHLPLIFAKRFVKSYQYSKDYSTQLSLQSWAMHNPMNSHCNAANWRMAH